jgi:hypothetical protein
MIPLKQTKLHTDTQKGNCFYATLASILHLNIEDIPNFEDGVWQKQLNEWLRQYGLAFLEVDDFGDDCKRYNISGCYHEIGGYSERSNKRGHSCVGLDGTVVFDPHPSDTGLVKEFRQGIFISLEPWKLTNG